LFSLQTVNSQNINKNEVTGFEKVKHVEKDTIIKNLKQENKDILSFGIVLFTVLIIMFFFAGKKFKKINNKLREKNTEIYAQREKIETQKNHITQKTIDLLVLNKELKENNELREGLMNMIVHDLKNPISNIINISENREITFFAKDMLTMVENILDIKKYEGMLMPLNKKNISLKKNVNEAIKQISIFAEHKNIKILNKVENGLYVLADENILRRIFANLLSNAVKYTFANGTIKIESEILTGDTDTVKVSVTDNGIGIKEESIPLIFNKFSQILARKTGEARSTGIGLSFCKMAVEAHESSINVKSVPKEFTSFNFFLPLTKTKMNQSKQSNDSEKLEIVNLNIEEKKYLQKFYSDLNSTEVYEISELRIITDKIDESFSLNIKKWKSELNKAIYNCNLELYNKLKENIN